MCVYFKSFRLGLNSFLVESNEWNSVIDSSNSYLFIFICFYMFFMYFYMFYMCYARISSFFLLLLRYRSPMIYI